MDAQLNHDVSCFMTSEEKETWSLKAISLICFIIPREVRWVPISTYKATVNLLLTFLNKAMQAISRTRIPALIKEDISEVLLAASKAGNCIRQNILPTVAELVDEKSPLHLRAEMAHQKSISSRLAANFDSSERAIHDFCCDCGAYDPTCISRFYRQFDPDSVNKKTNALYGRLHGSNLENLVQCDKYERAVHEVDD